MSREETNKLQYTIALIADFAKTYHIKQRQAFNYLRRFNGLEFLKEHYHRFLLDLLGRLPLRDGD